MGTQLPQVVLGFDENGDGTQQYYSTLDVEIYLHDYLVLQKHIMQAFPAAHRILYEGQSGGTITPTIFKNAFKDAFVNFSGSNFNASTLKQALNAIKGMPGRGQFVDFYDSVKVKDGTNLNDDSFRVSAATVEHRNNLMYLMQRQYMYDTNSFGQTEGGSGPYGPTELKSYALRTQDESTLEPRTEFPFEMSFSNIGQQMGNGPAGLGFSTQGFGYLVLPQETTFLESPTDSSAKYPDWASASYSNQDYSGDYYGGGQGAISYALGFVPPWILENFNPTGEDMVLNSNVMMGMTTSVQFKNPVAQNNPSGTYDAVEYIIPTIRMRKPWSENPNGENYYYPVPTPYLDGSIDTYYGETQNNYNVQFDVQTSAFLLVPGNYLSTFAVLLGNLEYVDAGYYSTQVSDGDANVTPSTLANPYYSNGTDIAGGARYYNYLSRLLLNTDKMFSQFYNNSSAGNFGGNQYFMTEIEQGTNAAGGSYFSGYTPSQVTNGVDDRYIMTVPLTLKVFSETDDTALPATLNVKIVYSKEAAQQSIGYSAQTVDAGFNTVALQDGGSYWRPWDKIDVKYYGQRWWRLSSGSATDSDFTTDPTSPTMDTANGTSTGYKIFRNKIGGTQVQ